MNKKEFYESLSDEVKAKIKACKSEEEMLKLLEQEKIELPSELLDAVSGGAPAPCFQKWNTDCPQYKPCVCD